MWGKLIILTLIGLGGASSVSSADREYDKLFEDADIIVIACCKSSKETKEKMNLLKSIGEDIDLGGIDSSFEVRKCIKGKCDNSIVVFHFKITASKLPISESGPYLFEFKREGRMVEVDGSKKYVPTPDYMLFLKKGADGRYELVRGQLN